LLSAADALTGASGQPGQDIYPRRFFLLCEELQLLLMLLQFTFKLEMDGAWDFRFCFETMEQAQVGTTRGAQHQLLLLGFTRSPVASQLLTLVPALSMRCSLLLSAITALALLICQ
jgi:hypothetical protein